jgi:hypothetical protein
MQNCSSKLKIIFRTLSIRVLGFVSPVELRSSPFGIWLLLLAGIWLFSPRLAFAQALIKITAIPPRLEIKADPGEVVTRQLKVKNEGNTQLGLEVKVRDFVVFDKKGTPLPVEADLSNRWAASLWINVSPKKFLLNPGETKALDFVAVVPENANPGGHYAVVFYAPVKGEITPQEGDITSGTGVSPNVGSLIYLTVSGDIKEDARVVRMDVPRFSEYGPIAITTEIMNLSDVHIRPRGGIKVYDWLGREKATLNLKEQNIFPGSTRIYQNTWPQRWGFGKYRATLEAAFGERGKMVSGTVFFWIVPWRVITAAVLAVVIVVLLIIYFRKGKKEGEIVEPASQITSPGSEDEL